MVPNFNKKQYSLKDKIKMYDVYIGQLQDELCACSEIKAQYLLMVKKMLLEHFIYLFFTMLCQ